MQTKTHVVGARGLKEDSHPWNAMEEKLGWHNHSKLFPHFCNGFFEGHGIVLRKLFHVVPNRFG